MNSKSWVGGCRNERHVSCHVPLNSDFRAAATFTRMSSSAVPKSEHPAIRTATRPSSGAASTVTALPLRSGLLVKPCSQTTLPGCSQSKFSHMDLKRDAAFGAAGACASMAGAIFGSSPLSREANLSMRGAVFGAAGACAALSGAISGAEAAAAVGMLSSFAQLCVGEPDPTGGAMLSTNSLTKSKETI